MFRIRRITKVIKSCHHLNLFLTPLPSNRLCLDEFKGWELASFKCSLYDKYSGHVTNLLTYELSSSCHWSAKIKPSLRVQDLKEYTCNLLGTFYITGNWPLICWAKCNNTNWGRQNNPPHPLPNIYVLTPGSWKHIILRGKRDIADVIELRILRWGHYPGLPRWAQRRRSLQKEGRKVGVGEDVIMEVEIGLIWVHEPRNDGKVKKMDSFLELLEQTQPYSHLKTDFGLLTSRTERQ